MSLDDVRRLFSGEDVECAAPACDNDATGHLQQTPHGELVIMCRDCCPDCPNGGD